MIDNGLNNGTRYMLNTRVLATVAQGGVFEECFRDATDGVAKWPSVTDWLKQENGVVVVNPGGTSASLSLGGSFVDPSGRSVTSATIAPHTGEIFTN